MPFNGSGLFVRIRNWVADATAGIKIRADYHDLEDDGFADGLSQCIVRDGQSVVLANIPMNSKRLVSLADPVDPQDAVTKAYDDLKLPLTGGTITGSLTVNGQVTTTAYKCRAGFSGAYGANWFNFNWTASGMEIWADNYKWGIVATQDYVETRAQAWAHAIADPKVNRAGDTMTGGLTVNGELVAAATYLRFQSSGGPGYIIWNGGGSYALGGGGNIWHTGNLNPVQSVRLAGFSGGTVCTGVGSYGVAGGITVVTSLNLNYLQYLTPGGWVTVGG
jgi:hypothetical protein